MNAPTLPLGRSPRPKAVMPEEPVLPLSVEAYHALLEAGILKDGDPIELLEGFMVFKMPKGKRHEFARRKLRRLLERLISAEFFVDEQGVVTTTDSEPEPDVFVVRGDIDDYLHDHAGPEDAVLIAEIADSSIQRDRGTKQRVYARAKVAVYWIVDLVENRIDVFTRPSGPGRWSKYAKHASYAPGQTVPVEIDGKVIGQIAVAEVIGSAKADNR